MKKRGREINIFSISALDLFASALGAFILMSLIFMVFFTMISRDAGEAEQSAELLALCEAELNSAETRAADLDTLLAVARARRDELEAQLAETVDSSAYAACQARLAESEAALDACQSSLQSPSDATEQYDLVVRDLQQCQRDLQRTFMLVIASWSSTYDVDLHVVDPAGREFYYRARTFTGSPAAFEEDNIRGPGNEIWLHPSADSGRYRVCYKLFSGLSSTVVRGSILWRGGKIEVPNINLTRSGQIRLVADVLIDNNTGRVSVDRSRSGIELRRCGRA